VTPIPQEKGILNKCRNESGAKKTSYVYLLRSMKDGNFYVGWTTDVNHRLKEHNAGLTRSTKARRPFELVGYETYPSSGAAKKRERTLKHCPHMNALFKKRLLNQRGKEAAGVTTPPFMASNLREVAGVTPPPPSTTDSKEVVG